MGGMAYLIDERGTTLVEALVAGSLLVILIAGLGTGLLEAHRLAQRAELTMRATAAVRADLSRLAAEPWVADWGGGIALSPALALTAPDALDRNDAGAHDVLDAAGQPTAIPGAGPPALVRRRRVADAAGDPARARSIEVCAFAWPADAHASPLVCAGIVRMREP
jgi:hypothetical protein